MKKKPANRFDTNNLESKELLFAKSSLCVHPRLKEVVENRVEKEVKKLSVIQRVRVNLKFPEDIKLETPWADVLVRSYNKLDSSISDYIRKVVADSTVYLSENQVNVIDDIKEG